MTPLCLLVPVLSWGTATVTAQRQYDYLGVIEKIEGEARERHEPRSNEYHVWARVAFKRNPVNEWVPATRDPADPQDLDLAPGDVPAVITWRACREGRALGTVVSRRRRLHFYADRGTQALPVSPAFADAARYEERFKVAMNETAAIRPFVVSTLPDACKIGSTVREVPANDISRAAAKVVGEGGSRRLREARGWQAGPWTIVELEYNDENNTHLWTVLFIADGEIRRRVPNARMVDFISADGDDVPDAILQTSGYNEDGYVLVYGTFGKQVAFSWSYH